jgi:protein phosphatase
MALTASNFWERFKTDWVCLDCELMPWSAKAQALLQQQYAAVGAAATHSLAAVEQVLAQALARGIVVDELCGRVQTRATAVNRFVEAYRHYCWPTHTIYDFRLAPFHVLASEGQVFVDRTHLWHMAEIAHIVQASSTPSVLFLTRYQVVDLGDEVSEANGVAWWQEMTEHGGEGMVVKPLDFIHKGEKGLSQPAVKVRGRDYLRIIYGPEYTLPEQMTLLRKRHVAAKRSLAVREFALGVEALERFVRQEPLRRVHECVFAILALESEPVDPRL